LPADQTIARGRTEAPAPLRDPSRDAPVFIISMMRSGSSLLYALLNQHPQVALTFEAELAVLSPVFLKPKSLRDWPLRWEFYNQALSRHGIDISELSAADSFAPAFESAHRQYARNKGALIWGDKAPGYYDRMSRLAKQFPGSSFVIVWRNPADVARSMVRAAAGGASEFLKPGIKMRALLGYKVFRDEYSALVRAGVPVHAVSYEELVRDTRTAMEGVCRFLRIPFDEQILTLENADRSAVYEGAHHRTLRGDKIVRDNARPEVLDAEWQRKISRYVRFWQRTESGWPPYPKSSASDAAEPGWIERRLDGVQYAFWKLFDRFAASAFSFVPLSALRRYRARKASSSFESLAYRGNDAPSVGHHPDL
jgi:hypothetical protein